MTTQEWHRLARLLEERRAEIRPEWVDRTTFAKDNNLSYRTLSDLESARRDNYRAAWLTRVEDAYRWQSGSIQRVLEGADPVPLDEAGPESGGDRPPDEPPNQRTVYARNGTPLTEVTIEHAGRTVKIGLDLRGLDEAGRQRAITEGVEYALRQIPDDQD